MKNISISFLLGLAFQAQSQVYTAGDQSQGYYNIVPDTLLNWQYYPYTNETYSLNIFGGTGYDVELIAHGAASSGGSAGYMMVHSLNPDVYIRFGRWDSVYVPADQNYYVTKVAKPLQSGDTINAPTAIWDNTSLYLIDRSGHGGGNKNVSDFLYGDKYIGLKFIDSEHYNAVSYGWILMRCVSEDSCYVREYALRMMPTGLSKIERKAGLSIYPNPTSSSFVLTNAAQGFQNVQVLDALGKRVDVSVKPTGDYVEVRFNKEAPAGCYFVRCEANNEVVVRKLVKIDAR